MKVVHRFADPQGVGLGTLLSVIRDDLSLVGLGGLAPLPALGDRRLASGLRAQLEHVDSARGVLLTLSREVPGALSAVNRRIEDLRVIATNIRGAIARIEGSARRAG